MSPFACQREREVAELLRLGRWPHAVPSELRDHAAACRSCSELILVTLRFQQARAAAATKVPIQSAGALWWRAQLRRRNEAIERINKPIVGAQIFAFIVTIAAAAGILAWQVHRGFHFLAWIESLPAALHFDSLFPALMPAFSGLMLLVPVLAMLALVSGVVVYLASEKQ